MAASPVLILLLATLRLLAGLDDEILVRLGELVEERLVDQDSCGLDK